MPFHPSSFCVVLLHNMFISPCHTIGNVGASIVYPVTASTIRDSDTRSYTVCSATIFHKMVEKSKLWNSLATTLFNAVSITDVTLVPVLDPVDLSASLDRRTTISSTKSGSLEVYSCTVFCRLDSYFQFVCEVLGPGCLFNIGQPTMS